MMFLFHGRNYRIEKGNGRARCVPDYVEMPMNAEGFAALSPAMQTEAVLMMADIGVPVPQALRATGLDQPSLRAVLRARPQVSVAVADKTERESEASAAAFARPVKSGVRGLSDNGRKILSLLVEKGGTLRAGIRTIEDLTGIPPYGAPCQMKRLIEAGLVEKLEAPHSTRATLWSVTPEGRRVLAACEAKDAANA